MPLFCQKSAKFVTNCQNMNFFVSDIFLFCSYFCINIQLLLWKLTKFAINCWNMNIGKREKRRTFFVFIAAYLLGWKVISLFWHKSGAILGNITFLSIPKWIRNTFWHKLCSTWNVAFTIMVKYLAVYDCKFDILISPF